jgi:hypothetical protein
MYNVSSSFSVIVKELSTIYTSHAISELQFSIKTVHKNLCKAAQAVIFPPWRPGFQSGTSLVGFVVDRAAPGRFPLSTSISPGVRGNVVVKALCYKPEGRGFETR